jgi:DNA-binding response OmpR family regulator
METLEDKRIQPTVMLLSDDEALAGLLDGVVEPPWKLVRDGADGYIGRKVFAQPNVRLIVLDDQGIKENDHSWLLAQIRKHFPGRPLLYVASNHNEENERRARTNGANYYASKPVSQERFAQVLRSFLQTMQLNW